jgi:hypothetical protein
MSKSLLAKLLATENISIQRSASASTAAFDIKNRVLILPVWKGISEDLEDMLVVHEVGHALDTPADKWLVAIKDICKKVYGKENDEAIDAIKGFMNVIEDARIDKRQKRRYPGSRRNYLIGYKELIERDFFGTANRDINSFSFIDRLNMYFKGGFNAGIKFSNEEMPFVKRIEAAETFEEIIQLTEELFKYSKEKGEDQLQNKEDMIQTGFDEDGEEGDDFDFGDDDLEEADDDGDQGKSKGFAKGEGEEEVETDEKPKKGQSGSAGDDFVPESQTEKAWQSRQSEILSTDNTEYHYVTVPKFNYNSVVRDYKSFLEENRKSFLQNTSKEWMEKVREAVTKFRNEDNATISFMVKEFEMKKSADIFSRISIAKTGVIDTNRLYSYKYNDDIFRRQSIVPQGKNHGFVMVLDWSGSMLGNIRETVKQLISLTSFCKRTQIPFEVYIFRDRTQREYDTGLQFDYKKNDLMFGSFTMRNVLSSRMKSHELLEAYAMLWAISNSHYNGAESMGGTPLNQAIVVTEEIVKRFKASSKAQIVNVIFLTDGESNPIERVYDSTVSRWDANGKHMKNVFILQDKEVGKEYHFKSNEYSNSSYMPSNEVTINLLKRLKDRTGANLLGFYLYDTASFPSVLRTFYGYSVDSKFEDTLKKSWSENKFIPVTSHGYDDYYIINTKAMMNTENKLEVNSEMTKAKIAKEFMKFSEKKAVNRVLLRRFIDKVA